MRLSGSSFGQHLAAGVGNQQRLLELRRPEAVLCNCRPIVRPLGVTPSSLRYHRFDGERLSSFHHSHSLVFSIVGHIGCGMKESVYSMSTVALHNTEAVSLYVTLNHVANVPKTLAGSDHVDCFADTLVGDFHQLLVFLGNITHEEGLVEVSVETPMVDGHVHIAKIAVLQRPHVRDSVTNYFVDTGATGFGEVVVVQWTRIAVVLYRSLVDDAVHLVGGYTHSDCVGSCVQAESSQPTGDSHALDLKVEGKFSR